MSAELVFEGSASHGGALRSQNALEALELAVQTVERLRGTRFHDVVVGHVVRAGGLMPSITPAEARLWVTVRHERLERADAVYAEVLAVAAEAARLARTRRVRAPGGRVAGLPPERRPGRPPGPPPPGRRPPRLDGQDLDWMAALSRACAPEAPFELDRGLALHTDGCDPYGQDDGEASWRIPLGRVNWAIPGAVPLHHWGTTALSGSAAGLPGPLMAGEALALAAVELATDAAVVRAARDELARRVGGRPPSPPRWAPLAALAGQPERFWDGSWRTP